MSYCLAPTGKKIRDPRNEGPTHSHCNAFFNDSGMVNKVESFHKVNVSGRHPSLTFFKLLVSKVKEINQNMVARMFDNLRAKIHSADENGLYSLL